MTELIMNCKFNTNMFLYQFVVLMNRLLLETLRLLMTMEGTPILVPLPAASGPSTVMDGSTCHMSLPTTLVCNVTTGWHDLYYIQHSILVIIRYLRFPGAAGHPARFRFLLFSLLHPI